MVVVVVVVSLRMHLILNASSDGNFGRVGSHSVGFGVLHKPMALQHNIKIIDHFGKVEKGGHGGSKECLTKIDVNIFTQEPDLSSNLVPGRKKSLTIW